MNMSHKFYDTCALLAANNTLFSEQAPMFYLSSITFKELENIKTAQNKDADIKYIARLILHLLNENPNKYKIIVHKQEHENLIISKSLEVTNDTKILSDALTTDAIFVTNDLALKQIARIYLPEERIESITESSDDYTGYKKVIADDVSIAEFYQDMTQNRFDLLDGQYLILQNSEGETIDLRVWSGKDHRCINTKPFNSSWFGKIEPYEGDLYQKLLFDSLRSNKITLVRGPAGSGKSFISLAYLMSRLENHTLDKIIIFCNTVATANSAKLGLIYG